MSDVEFEGASASIVVLGDICPEWGFPELFATGDAELVFHDLLSITNDADYTVANLEAPASHCKKKLHKNSVHLKAKPEDITVIASAGVQAVSLANNHILDYGVEGLDETIGALNKVGIANYGAGDMQRAACPHIVDLNGIRVGFLAFAEREFNCALDYGKGANLWDDLEGIRAIRAAKQKCDYLIIQYHGGIEHYIYPSPRIQKKCRAMAEAGADFVTCQHSHIVGTREKWCESEILYGQGNTIFGYEGDSKWDRGLVCVIDLVKDETPVQSKIKYIPIVATTDGEWLAQSDEAHLVLGGMEESSVHLQDSGLIHAQWKEFCAAQAPEYLPMLFGWRVNLIRANKVLKGKLVNLFVGRKQRRNAMNLIRCDAHREVVETILENDLNGYES